MQSKLATDFGLPTDVLEPVRAIAERQLQHATETAEERRKR